MVSINDYRMHAIITLVLLQATFRCVYTNSFEKHLFGHYSSIMKPRKNQGELVEVNISMTIKTVMKIDERFQYISFYAWFDVQWRDEFLTWNETEHPEIKRINVPYQKGHVTWYPGAMYTMQCHLKLEKFPFDEQRCNIVVGAWQTTDWMQTLVPQRRAKTAASEIAKNGEWDFKQSTFFKEYNSEFDLTQIVYTLVFQRRCLYSILCTIMPVITLAILNSLTFLIPAESGERITFCLTLFLTFTVFLTLFDQTMPRNSTNVPYITVFIAFHLFLCVISTIVSILTISFKTETRNEVEPFETPNDFLHSNSAPGDNDKMKRSVGTKQKTRKCLLGDCCRNNILSKIDFIMLVMNFLFLGLSTVVLTICYIAY